MINYLSVLSFTADSFHIFKIYDDEKLISANTFNT